MLPIEFCSDISVTAYWASASVLLPLPNFDTCNLLGRFRGLFQLCP
jgi:hypothetical protein